MSVVRFFEDGKYDLVGDMGSCGGRQLARASANEWARGGRHESEIDFMCLCLVSIGYEEEGT